MACDDQITSRIDINHLLKFINYYKEQEELSYDSEFLADKIIQNFRHLINKKVDSFSNGEEDFLEMFYTTINELKYDQ